MLGVLVSPSILSPAPEASLLPLWVWVLRRGMLVGDTVAVLLAVLHELRVETLEDIDSGRSARLGRR